jgi:hypothetical protein
MREEEQTRMVALDALSRGYVCLYTMPTYSLVVLSLSVLPSI